MKHLPAFITNPYLKLVYYDLYQIALQNNGLIQQFTLDDVFKNQAYLDIQAIYYPHFDKEVQKKITELFLTPITKTFVQSRKEYGLKLTNVGEYFFSAAYEACQEVDFLNAFIKNGIDPFLFLKVALRETKKTTSYQFSTLSEIFSIYVKEDDKREEKRLAKIREEIEDLEIKSQRLDFLLQKKGIALINEIKALDEETLAMLFEHIKIKTTKEEEVKSLDVLQMEKAVASKNKKEAQEKHGNDLIRKMEALSKNKFVEEKSGLLFEMDEKLGIFQVKEKGWANKKLQVGQRFYFGASTDWERLDFDAKISEERVVFNEQNLSLENIYEAIIETDADYVNQWRNKVVKILLSEGKSESNANSLISKMIKEHGKTAFYNSVKEAIKMNPLPVNFLGYCIQLIYLWKEKGNVPFVKSENSNNASTVQDSAILKAIL